MSDVLFTFQLIHIPTIPVYPPVDKLSAYCYKPCTAWSPSRRSKPDQPISSRAPVVELSGLQDGDGFKLKPTIELADEQVPLIVDLEVVYDLLQSEGDPFKHHSHFDFDFTQKNPPPPEQGGVIPKTRF